MLADRLGIDLSGQPEPHRMVVVVPVSAEPMSYWQVLGMHPTRGKVLEFFRTQATPPPRALLVDLDAACNQVQPIAVDHDRVELGQPRSLADCTPEWLTATFGPSAPRARSGPFDPEPPDLPGPPL